MPDLTITVTDAQLKVLRQLDAVKTAKAVVQIHVDTWLAPLVGELAVSERKAVADAYVKAAPTVQTSVKGLLGVA